MLYTKGFLLAGALATALTLAALAELPARPGSAGPALGADDLGALEHLGAAVDTHEFPRDRIQEPDFDMAQAAHDAAELASGRTRAALLRLADAASRSALAFLVEYNLAAGGWESTCGVRMPAATPAAA